MRFSPEPVLACTPSRLSPAYLVLLVLAALLALSGRSAAQPPPGVGQWCADIIYNGPAYTVCGASPAAVCQIQVTDKLKLWDASSPWELYGVSDDHVWYWKRCDARHPTPPPGPPYYYSHPGVDFRCGVGYTAVPGGRCVLSGTDYPQGPTDRCQTNNGGRPNPSTPHPIDILTGSKMLRATDFTNVTRSLLLERFFVSGAYGGTGDPATGASNAVIGLPNTLANWTFGFSYELQIPDDWPSTPRVTVLTPAGGAYVFERNSDGSMSPYRPAARPLPQTDYLLSFVGTWPSDLATLKTAASSWKLTGPDGETILLTTQVQKSDDPNDPLAAKFVRARPTKITQRSGLAWSFSYGSRGELTQLTDSYGNLISFEWLVNSSARAITAANLPNGYKIRYVYGSAAAETVPDVDRLIRVEYLDDQGVVRDKTIYRYADDNHPTFVTRVDDLNGTKRWGITYDTLGRATKSAAALDIDAYLVSYGADGSSFTRTVTNPLGKQAIYTFQRTSSTSYDQQLTRIDGQPSANCPWAGARTFTYDTSGFLASIVDEEGRTTAFTRSSRGFATRVTQAQGTAVERTANLNWSTSLRLPTRIDQPGSSAVDYDYQNGNLFHLTATDETSFTVPYATNGRTRVWTYGWSPTGQLLTVDGPLPGTADTTTYSYDSTTGYLHSITNPLGQVTQVSTVDWRGAPASLLDPNGVNSTATYDIHGRLLTATVAPGPGQSFYQFEYDPVGNLSKITLPAGGFLQYSYDNAGRLTQIVNDRGEKLTFGSDANRDVTSVVASDAVGNNTFSNQAAYDELGRLIRWLGAAAPQTYLFGYDKVGNLTQVTDARGKLSQVAFDALDRPVTATDPESHSLRYAYDQQDGLTSFKDGRGLETTRAVDGFGQVIQESSPDRGTQSRWYDEAGRLTKTVDAAGQETDFTYDAAGRRLGTTFPASPGENVLYTYDQTAGGNRGIGRLTKVTNNAGSSQLTYDDQGRIVTEIKTIASPGIAGRGYTVSYGYDASGKVTQVILPSGRTVLISRGGDGRPIGISSQTPGTAVRDIATSISFEPFGPLRSLTYSNGLVLTRSHDLNYWLSGVRVSDGTVTRLDLTFNRNNNGQVATVVDNTGGARGATYGYTDAGRLQSASGPWGQDTYAYDGAGNQTQSQRTANGSTSVASFVLQSATNRLDRVANGAGATLRSFTFLPTGPLSTDTPATGPSYRYYYDASHRLSQAQQISGSTSTILGNYGYDALGRRIWKSAATGAGTHFLYDLDGHLLAEHDAATGNVQREYIWLDDLLVALFDYSSGSAVRYDIHSGQLGEPLVITKNNKNKAWDAYVEPYGAAGFFALPALPFDGRLPGQWLQAETAGLHQNWFRDYDPSLGRYIEPDPLGLLGGQNAYTYVDGRPTELIDRDGRFFSLPEIGYGALAGGTGAFISSHGDLTKTAEGAVIGGLVGAIVPEESGAVGTFIGGVTGDLLTQTLDNLLGGRPLVCIDLGHAIWSGAGGAAGGALGGHFASQMGLSHTAQQVTESFFEGVGSGWFDSWHAFSIPPRN